MQHTPKSVRSEFVPGKIEFCTMQSIAPVDDGLQLPAVLSPSLAAAAVWAEQGGRCQCRRRLCPQRPVLPGLPPTLPPPRVLGSLADGSVQLAAVPPLLLHLLHLAPSPLSCAAAATARPPVLPSASETQQTALAWTAARLRAASLECWLACRRLLQTARPVTQLSPLPALWQLLEACCVRVRQLLAAGPGSVTTLLRPVWQRAPRCGPTCQPATAGSG